MKRNHHIFILLLIAFSMFLVFSGCEMDTEEVTVDWKTATIESMSIEQKVGQMFCLTVDPIRYFFYPQYKQSINTLVSKYHPGGIYLSANLDSVKMEIRLEFNGHKLHDELVGLQRLSGTPLFIGTDFESGAWYWDNKATRFTYPLALSAIGSGEYAFRQGKITSVEARAQGVNWILMPNCSLNPGASDIMMMLETLGDNADVVSDHSAQFIRGIQEAGSAATMKHYPAPSVNAILDIEAAAIGQEQVSVFQTGISSNVATMVTSPVDPASAGDTAAENWAASLQYLTGTLGYKGLTVTEFLTDLDSGSAADELDILKAGIDAGTSMFILPEVFTTTIPVLDLLVSDTVSGRYEAERIESAITRIVNEKADTGLDQPKIRQSIMYMSGLGLPEYYQSSRDIASESVTILKNDGDIIPVDSSASKVVSFSFLDDTSLSFSTIYRDEIRERDYTLRHMDVFGAPDMRIRRELIRRAEFADVVLLSFFYKPDEKSGTVFSDELAAALKEIKQANRNIVATSFYDPTLLDIIPDPKAYLVSYSPSEFSMEAVLDIILGAKSSHGKLPFTLSEDYPAGFGLSVNP